MKKLVLCFWLFATSAWCQSVFSCPPGTGFNTGTGACGAGTGSQPFFFVNGFSSVSGSVVNLLPTGQTHIVTAMNYTTKVSTTAFTGQLYFVPNGQFLALVLQNHPGNAAAASGKNFNSGAGCESGFFQSSVQPANVEYIFAMEFDSYNPTAISPPGSGAFSYSNVQIYQTVQSPCSVQGAETQWWGSTKRSTSPVALNSPSGTQNTTTGDTYIASYGYDGSTFSLCLADTTLGNNCTSSTAGTGTIFTTTWSNVSIPSLVNGTTAYLGLTTADGLAASFPLNIPAWSHTTVTPTASVPSGGVQSGGAVQASNPTLSPPAGSYSGTQSVTITCPTTSSYACYELTSAGQTIMPLTDNYGGCTAVGTLYSSPVSVSSSNTLYAVCGMNNNITTPSGLAANINSGIVQAAYVIGGTGAATPTFSPGAGSYGPAQSVTISTTSSGAIICYNTAGSPATNGSTGCTTGTLYTGPVTVSSSETLYAVAGGTGFTDSSVGSAAYTINGAVAKPTFSPPAGPYLTTQTVSISTTTSGASIFYNTTGSPTCSSTPYTGPLTVSSSQTLYAVGCKTGYSNSTTASAVYTIGSTITCTGNMTVSGNVSIVP